LAISRVDQRTFPGPAPLKTCFGDLARTQQSFLIRITEL